LQNFGSMTFTSAEARNTTPAWVYGGHANSQYTFVMENTNRLVLADTSAWYGTNSASTNVDYENCQ